ncbi:MAG: hypothetical protein J1E39_04360 [Eubacterium sp.]|nr:hypothetical protein [Eubacterium sp.]
MKFDPKSYSLKKLNLKKEHIFIIAGAIVLIAVTLIVILTRPQPVKGLLSDDRTLFVGDSSLVLPKTGERRDTLIIGISSAPMTIHPYIYDDEAGTYLKRLVYEPLVNIDGEGRISYLNASGITITSGNKAVVRLDTSRTFSDGTHISAENVKASYEWFKEQDSVYKELVENISEITVDSENTLTFSFYYPSIYNIEVFDIPLVYNDDPDSDRHTMLGTGAYKVSSLVPNEDIILEQNPFSKSVKDYKQVTLRVLMYSSFGKEIGEQQADVFRINPDDHFDLMVENGAYDIYASERDTGYYLLFNNISGETVRNAITQAIDGKAFFERSHDYGTYADGIVSAYLPQPNYHSLITEGSFGSTNKLTVLCGYDPASLSIYRELEKALTKKGVQLSRVLDDINETNASECDIIIYYGNYKDLINADAIADFYTSYPKIDAVDFYQSLEEYLSKKNLILPLQRDIRETASLAGEQTTLILQ